MSRRGLIRAVIIAAVVITPAVILLTPSHDSGESSRGADVVRGLVGEERGDRVGAWLKSRLGPKSSSGDDDEEPWIDLDRNMPWTSFDGGIPGYSVFSNLYLSSGTLLSIMPGPDDTFGGGLRETNDVPSARAIMSGEKKPAGGYPAAGEDRWRTIEGRELAHDELGSRAIRLPGVTYIFNDPPGPDGYLVYFEHFLPEIFIGASRVLSSVLSQTDPTLETIPVPRRIWFPRCGANPSWRDHKGLNAWFLMHALPGAAIEDAAGWHDRSTVGLPFIFDRVVIVDRWSAHSVGGETSKWGKMNADVPSLPAPTSFWDPVRSNLVRSLGVDGPSAVGKHGLPVVVYIDRRTSTQVSDETRTGLIDALNGLTAKAEVHIAQLQSMTHAKIVELVSRAKILIGVYGEEVLQSMWMQAGDGASVIEIFEEGGFIRDHQLLAASLNLDYILVHNDRVIDENGWRELGRVRGKGHEGDIPLDGTFIAGLVEEILDRSSI